MSYLDLPYGPVLFRLRANAYPFEGQWLVRHTSSAGEGVGQCLLCGGPREDLRHVLESCSELAAERDICLTNLNLVAGDQVLDASDPLSGASPAPATERLLGCLTGTSANVGPLVSTVGQHLVDLLSRRRALVDSVLSSRGQATIQQRRTRRRVVVNEAT